MQLIYSYSLYIVEENTRSDVDDTVMDLLTNYSLDEATSSDMPYTELFFEVLHLIYFEI